MSLHLEVSYLSFLYLTSSTPTPPPLPPHFSFILSLICLGSRDSQALLLCLCCRHLIRCHYGRDNKPPGQAFVSVLPRKQRGGRAICIICSAIHPFPLSFLFLTLPLILQESRLCSPSTSHGTGLAPEQGTGENHSPVRAIKMALRMVQVSAPLQSNWLVDSFFC